MAHEYQLNDSTTPTFGSIPDDHPLYRITAPLMAGHYHVPIQLKGTAFLIAPGWALTAQHVVVDYIERIQNVPVSEKLSSGGHHGTKLTFHIFMLVPLRNGRYIPLTVVQTYMSHPGDIAVLKLSKPDDVKWDELAPYPVLKLLPPNKNSSVSALGYPKSNAILRKDGVYEGHIWPRLSIGTVQEIHEKGRDTFLLNYPCFHVNARFDAGMSGGPVLDNDGNVCGVISKGYDLSLGEEPIGYVASLWVACRIAFQDMHSFKDDNYRFYDLMRYGLVMTVDIKEIIVEYTENKRTFGVYLRPLIMM